MARALPAPAHTHAQTRPTPGPRTLHTGQAGHGEMVAVAVAAEAGPLVA